MKKFLMTLAAVLCCAMVTNVCTSCTNDDASNTYSMGFDDYFYANVDEVTINGEVSVIEATFRNAIQQNLGVTVKKSSFYYEGGADKVKAACEKAGAELNKKTFKGHYVYVVSSTTTVYTWKN